MANRGIKIVGAIVVLAAVGAGAGWYVLSGQTVSQTQTILAEFNSKPATNGLSFKVQHESVTRAPFPHIGVRLVNPTFELTLPADAEGKTQTITSSSQGTTDVITDYIAKQYRIENRSGGTITTTMGTEKISQTFSPTTVNAAVTAKSFSDFVAWNKLNTNDPAAVKAALKNIQTVTMVMSPFTLTDTATNQPIMSQQKMELVAKNRSNDTQIDFDLAFELLGSEISPEYYALMDKFFPAPADAATPPVPSAFSLKGDMPFSPLRAGKQDMALELSINAPMGSRQQGTLDLRKFTFKNNFYTLSLPTKLTVKDTRNVAVNLNWSVETTPAAAAEMQRVVTVGGKLTGINAATPEEQEKIIAVLPNLSTLGPVTLVLDAETTAGQGASVTLRNFALNHQRWGLEAKGSGSVDPATGQKLELSLLCKKCDMLTWDGVTAAIQAQTVAELMKPGSGAWGITAETMTKLNALLADIGKRDAEGNISFVVATTAANDIRINDKPMAEAMMKAMVAFAPPPPPEAAELAPAAGEPAKKAAKK